jgi:tetraacyldisaccharide 4'-kinase
VFDERAQGNGRLLPAGPLREPLQRLHTVDAVLCSNVPVLSLQQSLNWPSSTNWHALTIKPCGFRNLKTGQLIDIQEASDRWASHDVAAFTGLGNPEKLFSALQGLGIELQQSVSLPDHFDYPDDFCSRFNQSVLITSGKDAVKLIDPDPRVWQVEIQIELPPKLLQTLEDALGSPTH